MQRSRRGLATWITGSQTPIFVLDQRNMVLVFNHGCEELTGWQAANVIGKTCEYVSDAPGSQIESITAALCPPAKVFDGEPAFVNSVIQTRDGEILTRGIHYFPLVTDDSNQRILGVILPREIASPEQAERPRHFELAATLAQLRQKYDTARIAATSTSMQRVLTQIKLASQSDVPVHLVGEKGSGKQYIARTIHYQSDRKSERFIPLNCRTGSYQEIATTLDQLLNVKGETFSGTVFLDDVDAFPRDLQNLIADRIESSSIRWMSSSTQAIEQLDEKVMSPAFRCLMTPIAISTPALRHRLSDIPLLAQQMIEECNRQGNKQIEGLESETETELLSYEWPGNVAELERFIHAAWEKTAGPLIRTEDLPIEFLAGVDARSQTAPQAHASLDEQLIEYERSLIEAALITAQGNKAHAAKLLKIPRPKLYRRLEVLEITDTQDTPSS